MTTIIRINNRIKLTYFQSFIISLILILLMMNVSDYSFFKTDLNRCEDKLINLVHTYEEKFNKNKYTNFSRTSLNQYSTISKQLYIFKHMSKKEKIIYCR